MGLAHHTVLALGLDGARCSIIADLDQESLARCSRNIDIMCQERLVIMAGV